MMGGATPTGHEAIAMHRRGSGHLQAMQVTRSLGVMCVTPPHIYDCARRVGLAAVSIHAHDAMLEIVLTTLRVLLL
jgi:hypothetical protein